MIGKLIKHDLKSGARRMGNIYLAALIASCAMIFSAFIESGFVRFLSTLVVIVVAFVAVIMTFASVVFGANKTLFGREGYLTQTLPVRTSSLIFSKWLTSSIWLLISYAFVLVAFVAIFFYWTTENQEGAQIYDMIYSVAQSFGLGAETVYQKTLIIQAVIGLFNMCIFVMYILFAITLSNISPFHKLGTMGIIIYLAVVIFAIQGISYGLENLCDVTLLVEQSGISMTVSETAIRQAEMTGASAIGLTGVYFKTIVTVFLYILTVQLCESKINLK
ncbi:MAG: hypothetical protein IKW03_09045 [Clostridia bacterium]|nr:hypothetical protein [Clostridia bacterium]